MIVSTDAIVLRSMKYGETSKIVTFYSRRYGKIKVIAKGARNRNNAFGASLEPMTHSSIVLYKKEQRDLHVLSKCEIAQPFLKLNEDGDRMAVGLAMIELVNMVMHDEEENQPMFALLLQSLEAIDAASGRFINVLFSFELRMSEIFGYELTLQHCSRCGRDIVEGAENGNAFLQVANGSIVCAECHARFNAGGIKVSKGIVRSLLQLKTVPVKSASDIVLSSSNRSEMFALLQTYLKYHIEGVRTLKSLSLFTTL